MAKKRVKKTKPPKPVVFHVMGDPIAQPRPRARYFAKLGRAGVYNPSNADQWKAQVKAVAEREKPSQPFEGPLKLSVTFVMFRPSSHFGTGKNREKLKPAKAYYHHRQKPDIDNLVKALMDAMEDAGIWLDDAQVSHIEMRKVWVRPSSKIGAYVTVEEIKDDRIPAAN